MIRTVAAVCALLLAACTDPEAASRAEGPPESADVVPAAAPAGVEAVLRAANAGNGELSFAFAALDLNDDGADEVLAYVMGPAVCGSGGCNLYVLTPEGDTWRTVTRTSVTQTPIGILPIRTNGWRDLAVSIGGGGAEAGWVRLISNGASYPANPTGVEDEAFDETTITTVIAADPDFLPLS